MNERRLKVTLQAVWCNDDGARQNPGGSKFTLTFISYGSRGLFLENHPSSLCQRPISQREEQALLTVMVNETLFRHLPHGKRNPACENFPRSSVYLFYPEHRNQGRQHLAFPTNISCQKVAR